MARPTNVDFAAEGMPSMLGSQQPDTVSDSGTYGPITVRGASVRGADHRAVGAPRCEDFCLAVSPDGYWYVAVATSSIGGSRAHTAARFVARWGSRMFAEVVARTGLDGVRWDDVMGRLAGQMLSQLRQELGDPRLDAGGATRAAGTSFAVAVLPTEPIDGARQCTVLAVGDASVWALRRGVTWQFLAGSAQNEGPAGAPRPPGHVALPLVSPAAPVLIGLDPGESVFLASSGVAAGLVHGGVADELAMAWSLPPPPHELAAQVADLDVVGGPRAGADRTLVGIWVEPTADRRTGDDQAIELPAWTGAPEPSRTAGGVAAPVDLPDPEPPPPVDEGVDGVPAPVEAPRAPEPPPEPAADPESAPEPEVEPPAPPRADPRPTPGTGPVVDPLPATGSGSLPVSAPDWNPPGWEPTPWKPPGSDSV